MKRILKNKGISLIVLVITILVIIVLAGAILLIVSKNNPLDNANESVYKSDIKNFQSELNLTVGQKLSENVAVDEMNASKTSNPSIEKYIPSMSNKQRYIDILEVRKGKLVYIGDDSKEKRWSKEVGIDVEKVDLMVIDVKMVEQEETSLKLEISVNKQDKIRGYKISKDDGVTYTEEQSGNVFILTGLVANTKYNIKIQLIDNEGNVTTSISYELTTKKSSLPSENPYIPTGFVHTEGIVNTGFVIKDTANGNEFVWIPVENIADFKLTDFRIGVAVGTETLPIELQNSVAIYGGYYIARYEAGTTIITADKASRNVSGIPISKQGQMVWNYIDWNNSKANAEAMYNNSEIATELIYGTMWDTACNWLVSSGNKTVAELRDSTSWGNYIDNTASGAGILQTTGYNESWKANNIYDLAGNNFEWTQEFSSTKVLIPRGGSYDVKGNGGFPVVYRNVYEESRTYIFCSFRPVLYHK